MSNVSVGRGNIWIGKHISTQQWCQFDCMTVYCLLKLHSTLHSMLIDMPSAFNV